ncbi:MAG TPA: HlyD family efflux transporter periplasmic adaptor subunit, partial [Kofleriaceae bacterium]|nr:HlyD family efflux transporter periplasmic adaptor subunit [Kofleriaceae bacterium]
RAVIAAVVIVALGGATAGLLRGAAPGPDEVATYTVARASFVRRVTAEGNLRAVKATRLSAPRSGARFGPMKIAWLAADGTLVKAGDVVMRFDSTEYDKQLRDGQADLDAASAKLRKETVKSSAAVAGRDSDAVLARDELDRTRKFQSKDEMIFSRNQIIESEVDEQLAGAKQTHAERAKQIERHLSVSNAAVITVERKKAELAIAHAEAALKSMEIVAPSDGIFVLERNWRGAMPKPGDSLWPGQAVAEIPILDAMEANVYVLEVDGSGLAEGQPAEVVIEARPDRVFAGKVRMVDKLAEPRQQGSPVQYFGVAIELAKTDREVMKPGQRVRATLVLDQQEALVVPRQAIVDRDGKTVVYRRVSGGFEAVAVELGPATSGRVVIAKGLAAGDEIALRDPTGRDARGSGSDASAPQEPR